MFFSIQVTLCKSMGHFLVPYKAMYWLPNVNKSTIDCPVLFITHVDHWANIPLSIYFANKGSKIVATITVCIHCADLMAISLFRARIGSNLLKGSSSSAMSNAVFSWLQCLSCFSFQTVLPLFGGFEQLVNFPLAFALPIQQSRARRWPPPVLCFSNVSFLNVPQPVKNTVLPAKCDRVQHVLKVITF